ncbi:hypothetical protein POM88_041621 [Heracleum sosnowskyi]|uniref:Uncharacterized protein n=1 Tax=Heracleum sosnowskyi TaxID=360622 RepID=A0AAD8M8H2_9APIA|nr:hypothetical protein POM88_041621 [Heracleum sosnowskyi]
MSKSWSKKTFRVASAKPGDGLGEGHGMLGQAGSGKLRISVGQNKLAAKVAKNLSSDVLQAHPGASKWKSTSFPHFDDLSTIFGKDRAKIHRFLALTGHEN